MYLIYDQQKMWVMGILKDPGKYLSPGIAAPGKGRKIAG
jgi:hypothetical protein